MTKRVPERLFPAFCIYVLAIKNRVPIYSGNYGDSGRLLIRAAQHIRFTEDSDLIDDARQVALEAAGGILH